MPAIAAYLENLNPEQRRAVEYGAVGPAPSAPLLVIASHSDFAAALAEPFC